MCEWKREVSFISDERAVSEVVGAILLFGILILALTSYQATIVPQQNAQTEFQHFEDVRNEMIELRNAISTAGQADVSQFPSVTLGTNYRTRIATINPPDPAGTLQTSDRYNITIANESGYKTNISTRFLEYQPVYHEISIGSMRYEHSVLYLDERERGNNVSIIEDQNIVKDGTVRITVLQNQFQETSTGRVTLELYPQDKLNESDFPEPDAEGNLTVSIPTRLNQTDYWDDALSDSGGIYQDVDPYPGADDIYHLDLEVNESDLEVNTVGVREEPDESPAKNEQAQINTPTAPTPTPTCTVGSNTNANTLQFDNLQRFSAVPGQDEWKLSQIQVQDSDGDADLDQLKIEITDSGDTVRATRTTSISGQQYRGADLVFSPDSGSYNVQGSETYTLTATVCDEDGNSRTDQISE